MRAFIRHTRSHPGLDVHYIYIISQTPEGSYHQNVHVVVQNKKIKKMCVEQRKDLYLITVSIHYFLWSTSYFYLHKALHESWCERIIFNMSDIFPFLGNCTDRQKLYARGHLVFSSGGFTRGCWREIQHTVQNTGEVVSCWDLPLYQVY